MADAGGVFFLAYLLFALWTGGVSIAVLVGNKGSSTGSCCLPTRCNVSQLNGSTFRPDSGEGGMCSLSAPEAAQMGCPEASAENIGKSCLLQDPDKLCSSLVSTTYARLAGILGVSSPFSPIIGLLLGLAGIILGSSSGGNWGITGSYFLVCSVLTTIAMYTATTVFAGMTWFKITTTYDDPYHAEPAEPCVTRNDEGRCTQWSGQSVIFLSNTASGGGGGGALQATLVCPLNGTNASVYGGRITGNIKTPIGMLFFLPVIAPAVILGLTLLLCFIGMIHKAARGSPRGVSMNTAVVRGEDSFVPNTESLNVPQTSSL